MESIDQTTTTDVCESSTVQPVQVNENEVDSINESFDALYAQVETFVKDLKLLSTEIKNVKKRYQKVIKTMSKSKKRKCNVTSDESTVKKEPSGFISPIGLSVELTDLLGLEPDVKLPRTVVTKKLIAYIKENHLENVSNGRNFDLTNAENPMAQKLKHLFNIEKGDEVNYFNLQSYLKPHFIPVVKQNPVQDVVENVETVEEVPTKLKVGKKSVKK